MDEYFIQIGLDGKCLVENMTNENITCLPPKEVPRTNNSNDNIVFIVVCITFSCKLGCYFWMLVFILTH
jgi:hypothetical protein